MLNVIFIYLIYKYILCLLLLLLLYCDGKATIALVFSVIRSYRNHSDIWFGISLFNASLLN